MLVLGSRYIIQLYLQFSSTSEVYGAAGSLVVMLIWIYITCLAVFYGASFSHAWAVTFGSLTPEKWRQRAKKQTTLTLSNLNRVKANATKTSQP